MSASHHEFSPAPGVDLSQAQAEAVGLELVRLQAKHGPDLRPADIVHAAADLRSPLHAFFTWENAKAADAWRRVEATRLVRSVTVRVTEGGSVREAPITLRLAEGDPDVRPPAPPVVLKIATPRQAYTLRDPVEAMIEDLRGFAVYYDRHHDDLPDAIRAALEEVRQAVEAALAAVSTRRAA